MNDTIKSTTAWFIVSAVVVVVFGGALTWANVTSPSDTADTSIISSAESTSKATTTTGSDAVATTTSTDEFSGWKTYNNTDYEFSFKYPGTWSIVSDTIKTATTTRKTLNMDADGGSVSVMINFEGGFEGASYYRKGEVVSKKISVTKSEDWTEIESVMGRDKQIFMSVGDIGSGNSLVFVYTYITDGTTATKLFDKIITTFQFN